MVIKINFHMHTIGSDGKLTPEQVIKESIKAKIDFMCFTDHHPAPNNIDPLGNNFYSDEHFQELIKLKEKYKGKIDISIGVEFDWIEGYDDWAKEQLSKRNYDFVIGSVHGFFNKNKVYGGIWWGPDKILDFINSFGGTKQYVQEYYGQVRLMVKSGLFDCVGHLDIIKYENFNNCLFSESDEWYKREIEETLDEVKKSGMVIEINTRGIVKRGEGKQYPSDWILKEVKKRNIPITIGTDAHDTGQAGNLIESAYNLAKQAGYKEIFRFKKRKPIRIEI